MIRSTAPKSVMKAMTFIDLPFVGDVRGHPGDKLQIVHRLPLCDAPAPAITNLALRLQEGRAIAKDEIAFP